MDADVGPPLEGLDDAVQLLGQAEVLGPQHGDVVDPGAVEVRTKILSEIC